MPDKPQGYPTRSGRALTEEDIGRLADEAARGYDIAQLRPRRRGRPPLGSGPAEVVPVRLDPDLHRAAQERAVLEGTTLSEIVRRAVRRYLGAA